MKKIITLLVSLCLLHFNASLRAQDNVTLASQDKDIFNPSSPPQIIKANAEFIYKFLLAEVAAQRGELNTAGHLYLDLAKLTKSIPLAERATRISGSSRNGRLALDAAKVWSKLEPNSLQVKQILAELYISSGNLSKATPIVKELLEQDKERGEGFLYLNSILSKVENKKNALRFIIKISKPYPKSKEAHFAVAHAAFFANKRDLANEKLDIIENIDSKWETAILFRGFIIQQDWPEKAEAFYRDYLRKNQTSNEVRLEYAKILTNLKKYDEAKKEFLKLVNGSLASADMSLTVALLAIELDDNVLAEKYFNQSLERGHSQPGQIYIYLSRIYEIRNDYDAAMSWVNKVSSGPNFLEAKILGAQFTAKHQTVDKALTLLDSYNSIDINEKLIILKTKASLLLSNDRGEDAYELMKNEDNNFKDSAEFKFDYAVLSEKMGNTLLMEQLLTEAIKLKPDYAVAYNALGYSYADRNINLDVAKRNIEIALSIQPKNHYILDSMGWVYYRLGNNKIALEFLRKAYAAQEDPEIAAHLGEVLWKMKEKEKASKIWQSSLRNNPNNKVLLDTIDKFR